jgi:hypothetical protein
MVLATNLHHPVPDRIDFVTLRIHDRLRSSWRWA